MALSKTIPIYLVSETKGLNVASHHDAYDARLERGSSLKAHKQLPHPRDFEQTADISRARYTISQRPIENGYTEDEPVENYVLPTDTSTNHVLPPTPPVAQGEDEAIEETVSSPATPAIQQSPPTPDITPPRRFLGAQSSMASTRAESFRTAREDFNSDDDDESLRHFRKSPASTFRNGLIGPNAVLKDRHISSSPLSGKKLGWRGAASHEPFNELPISNLEPSPKPVDSAPSHLTETVQPDPLNGDSEGSGYEEHQIGLDDRLFDGNLADSGIPRRGMSLRDRLKMQQLSSPSTDQFGSSIGWPGGNDSKIGDDLPPSKIEAMVFETPTPPKRQQTLRHSRKNNSLRSASSPIPVKSHRDSLTSNPESSPTLHRKKARLSNQNRWSPGSEISKSFSMMSGGVLPRTENEIIPVAVIPERRSSLRSSVNSSQRNSLALSLGSGDDYYPPNSYHSRERGSDLSYRRRSASDSHSPAAHRENPKADQYTETNLLIPPRRSSLSAPTSQSNSRTSSLTSRSDHHRTQRIAAEKDLRKTLDRMESERLMPKLQVLTAKDEKAESSPASGRERISTGWEGLHPPSVLNTPFSQPSAISPSPGPFEVAEARTVNFFPHNNHSLQLIEKHPLPESVTTKKARRLMASDPLTPSTTYDSKRTSQIPVANQSTSTPSTVRRSLTVDSPLRNPRQPPQPPDPKIVPPSSMVATEQDERQLVQTNGHVEPVSNPPISYKRRRSESFVRSLARNLSLRNPRNRKADQDLDGTQHSFWRPRGFWEGFNDSDDEEADEMPRERGLANNTLGIPHDSNIVSGPVALARNVSNGSRRRWFSRDLTSRPSNSSLSKLRASRKLYRIPLFGAHFRFMGLRDVQERILLAKARKEDEQREKRRADLRKSIGVNVISQGDSRFPASSSNPGFVLR